MAVKQTVYPSVYAAAVRAELKMLTNFTIKRIEDDRYVIFLHQNGVDIPYVDSEQREEEV